MASSKRHIIVSVVTRIVVCGLIIAVGVGVAGELVRTRPTPATVEGDAGRPRITVLKIANEPLAERCTGYGTIAAMKQVDVPARVAAIVVELAEGIRVGAAVQKDQLLVQLDPSDYAERRTMARAAVAIDDAAADRLDVEERLAIDRIKLAERDQQLAAADLDRARQASDGGAVSDREVDHIESRLLEAKHAFIAQREIVERLPILREELNQKRQRDEATLRLAEQAVERCAIRSPLTGVLVAVGVEEGESVGVGQLVARIVDPTRLELALHVAATVRGHVAPGDPVKIARPASDVSFAATVARISPTDDPATRTLTLYAELDGTASGFAPGLFVRGEVQTRGAVNRSVVPRRAVRNQRVMVVVDGAIAFLSAESAFALRGARPATGVEDLEWVVLETPLPEGSLVVVDGSRAVAQGTLVEAVETGGTKP